MIDIQITEQRYGFGLLRCVLAEFVGTFLLVLMGCGVSCFAVEQPGGGVPMITLSLGWGLVVATILWSIGHVSGGHINPAVSLAFFVTGSMSLIKFILYFVAQMGGALVGALLLSALQPVQTDPAAEKWCPALGATTINSLTYNRNGRNYTYEVEIAQAFGIEVIITAILVFVVMASTDGGRKDLNGSTPLTIGLTITINLMWTVQLEGASMNPARSFAPSAVSGVWGNQKEHWIYWIGPFVGAVSGAILYRFIFSSTHSVLQDTVIAMAHISEADDTVKLATRDIEETSINA